MAVVLALHGGGGTALGMERTSGLSAEADRLGFLVAYPQSLVQNHGRAPPGWDASRPGDPFADGIDDRLYVRRVLTATQPPHRGDPPPSRATASSTHRLH